MSYAIAILHLENQLAQVERNLQLIIDDTEEVISRGRRAQEQADMAQREKNEIANAIAALRSRDAEVPE